MGKAKLQAELGVTKEKAADLFNTYHERYRLLNNYMEKASNRAQDRGQIRTFVRRLCRFHLWEPNQFWYAQSIAGNHEEALGTWTRDLKKSLHIQKL